MTTLLSQLHQRMEEDRLQLTALTSKKLEQLAHDLQRKSANVLATTGDAMAHDQQRFRQRLQAETAKTSDAISRVRLSLKVSWIMSQLTALALLFAIALGAWGTTEYLTRTLRTQWEKSTQLDAQILAQQQTLEQLRATTWGLDLIEDGRNRWIVLPVGWTIGETGTFGARQAFNMQPR
ncbi:MAG: hypothetical protein AB7E47_12630 [Desulfovibrionaceae bacterium]